MSYDLFFQSNAKPLSEEQFTSYFSERPGYTLSENQAIYENESTGVYFLFEYGQSGEEGGESFPVTFNLNFFRPHVFALEAAGEIEPFVRRFELSVFDPQTEGIEGEEFTDESFLRGWNAGNRFAYRAILSQVEEEGEGAPELNVYSTAGLERVWRWNFQKETLQDQLGEDIFVPRILFMKGVDRARTGIVWPDAIPTLLPEVDQVLIIRDELAEKQSPDDPHETTIVEWAKLAPVLSNFSYDQQGGYYRPDYLEPPQRVSELVRSLPLVEPEAESILAIDGVLNAELVEEFTKPR